MCVFFSFLIAPKRQPRMCDDAYLLGSRTYPGPPAYPNCVGSGYLTLRVRAYPGPESTCASGVRCGRGTPDTGHKLRIRVHAGFSGFGL